jgi:Fe/S biogenesis protein NfuA
VTTTTDAPVFRITDDALSKILELRSSEDDGDTLGLRIEITGVRGPDYVYDLAFEAVGEATEGDVVIDAGIPVLIPEHDIEKLRGSELDLPSHQDQPGLVLRNPNRPKPPSVEDLDLTGTAAEKVQQLLEGQINPAIAAHGGWAELVGVRDDTAEIRLHGGCQGCSMSRATVAAGIEQSVREHIPEILHVVDVTDHESGENPYFD